MTRTPSWAPAPRTSLRSATRPTTATPHCQRRRTSPHSPPPVSTARPRPTNKRRRQRGDALGTGRLTPRHVAARFPPYPAAVRRPGWVVGRRCRVGGGRCFVLVFVRGRARPAVSRAGRRR